MTKKQFMVQCKDPGYVIRACNRDMTSGSGFRWPKRGYVCYSDWNPSKEPGNGLHGLLDGEGRCFNHISGIYHIVIIDKSKMIRLQDNVKFRDCYIHFCGERAEAWAELHRLVGNKRFHGSIIIAGYSRTLTAGNDSTLTAGKHSTLTAGDYATLTAGNDSTVTAGDDSQLSAGNFSTLTAGHDSTLTWRYWDDERYRLYTVYTGENGIKPNTPYNGYYKSGQFIVEEV